MRERENEKEFGIIYNFFWLYRASPILLALGIEETVAKRAIRLSVGRETTQEDIDCAVNDLKQALDGIKNDKS